MTSKDKSIGIDLLRCIAMFMVFFVHLNQRVYICEYFKWGAFGVQIFFVMSGYLCMISYNNSGSMKEYYRRRFNRFIPPYWGTLILVFAFHAWILQDVPLDNFHLGWIQYFCFLNKIVPSTEYFWNNLYGYWTMGAFALFYLVVPIIAKKCDTFRKSIIGFVITIFIQLLNNWVYKAAFSSAPIDISEFAGGTPFHDLYMFMIGVMVYYAIKEGDESEGKLYILLSVFVALGLVGGRHHYVFAALAAIYLMNQKIVKIKWKWIIDIIHIISKYSFAVYLTHMFCFDISEYICIRLFGIQYNSMIWIFVSLGMIMILSGIVVNIFGKIQIRQKMCYRAE